MTTTPLLECVPNFSEGRRTEVIDAIVDAIASGPVFVLDSSADADHNRCVVTFAGEPAAVLEAALRGIAAAAHLIDLTAHTGVHPRIGAADVVPLIPLRGLTLADAVALARQLGQRVAAELDLPVYLYEAAAQRPERTALEVVRRGGYETLRTEIVTDPARQPDYGPAQLGPAGAVVIGARRPLIAFNVYLNTDDVDAARTIAQAIRASSGGLPAIKALGLLVGGRAQVSMNVVDYRRTSLFVVMQAIEREAARLGVTVAESELIGLVPQSALLETALAYLRLPQAVSDQRLEQRLGRAINDYRDVEFE